MRYSQAMQIIAKACVLLVACWLLPNAAAASPSTDEFRHVLQHGVDRGVYRDLAIGWIDGSARSTWYLGKADKPDAGSAFEIGAITQVFTGLLLAQSVYKGKLGLTTTVSQVLGPDFSFADAKLATVSLESLATHRSGLRTVPANLFPFQIYDPYATYGSQDLLAWLANEPHAVGSDVAHYSILDSGLLGYLLARTYASEFSPLLQTRVLAPLGLSHTGFADTATLLSGYSSRDSATPHWHFDVLAGAAGLRSTLPDLLDFIQHNLRPESSSLRAAMLLARRPYTSDVAPEQYGLGWRIVLTQDGEQTWPLVWSASRTGGFSAFIGFRTDRQQGLVLLGNTDADLSALGLAWLEGRSPPDLPHPVPMRLTARSLAEFEGLYQLPDGTDVILRSDQAGLSAQWPGQAPIDVVFMDQDIFVAPGLALTLSFQREAGSVANVVIDHSGINVLAQRISTRAPHLKRVPLNIPPALADSIVGDFVLDADSLMRVRKVGSSLMLHMTGHAPTGLHLFAKDHFFTSDDSVVVTLEHGSTGEVTGLLLEFAGVSRKARRVHWRVP
ncbi:MAG: serine hydrolase domain-containing protein [Rudaea sp.]